MKKLISILLCLCLVLSLGVLSVFASEELSPEEAPESAAEAVPEEEAPLTLDGEEPDGGESGETGSGGEGEGGDSGEAGHVTPTDAEENATPSDAKKLDPIDELLEGAPEDPEVTSGVIAGTNLRWNVDIDSGVLTISGTGDMPDYADFDEMTNAYHPNTPWWDCRAVIRKIVVESGVTGLGSYAFSRLPLVTEVSLPGTLTDIRKGAFHCCLSLPEVTIPAGVTDIGNSAFENCNALASVTFPDGLKTIGANAFYFTILNSIALPDGLESIGSGAFYASSFTELTLPGSLGDLTPAPDTTGIQLSPFSGCADLWAVTLGEGITNVPPLYFGQSYAMEILNLPSTIRTLGHEFIILHDSPAALTTINVAHRSGYAFIGWTDENGSVFSSEELCTGVEYVGDLTATWIRTWEEGHFTDVSETAWYHDAVQFCYQAELMNGMSETRFEPNGSATRAQVVTVLWRLAGEPAAKDSDFSDVTGGKYYSTAVAWAADNGITNGYPDGTFRPNNDVTRQEFVTFLYRFTEAWAGEQPPSCDSDPLAEFADRDQVGSWAQSAECWSVAAGLQEGSLEGGVLYLNPARSIRRSELAAFLMRYCVTILSPDIEAES